ncbi:hypothetical protein AGLY_004186, partial [Aphis glycines]
TFILYLIGVHFIIKLSCFGPPVYFDTGIGIIIFKTDMAVVMIIPPEPGVSRKYLLQNSSDERRIGQEDPINIPKKKPMKLHFMINNKYTIILRFGFPDSGNHSSMLLANIIYCEKKLMIRLSNLALVHMLLLATHYQLIMVQYTNIFIRYILRKELKHSLVDSNLITNENDPLIRKT